MFKHNGFVLCIYGALVGFNKNDLGMIWENHSTWR